MRNLVTALFFFVSFVLFAQEHRYYCEVKGIEKSLSSGLKIIFDFGTSASYNVWGDLKKDLKFVDEKGKEIDFHSMVDAANYMAERGWHFQQAYSSVYGSSCVIHWIFFKDAETQEQAKEGIMTKEDYKKMKK
ncbi:MAG: hypothetical protein IJ635_09445 [Bacteroidaceae bacterium]|nr:hypothetical protein [Bacteroidaceae bacterium]MBR1667582.1 hypothetical protein [Bacteroidaceae bacterium]